MMSLRATKYALAITLPLTVVISFNSDGLWCFFPVFYAFGIVPALELLFSPNPTNLSDAEIELVKQDKLYDWLLYAMLPIQWLAIIWFCAIIDDPALSVTAVVGRTLSLGMMCGVIGINVAHELGHRSSKFEQGLAKGLLLSSLYMHFFIEHNRGHHRNVATHEDPATARKNEMVYVFWIRSGLGSWIHAWKLEADRLKRMGVNPVGLKNQMLQFQLLQLTVVLAIWTLFSLQAMLLFMAAAAVGALLLETVNYIEHYGLVRKQKESGKYERVMPIHSWNSNHVVGRLLLFELSRHSDHHYKASTPYPLLKHMDDAPQLPTGYPGMMLLSLIPPLFFRLMNQKIEVLQNK